MLVIAVIDTLKTVDKLGLTIFFSSANDQHVKHPLSIICNRLLFRLSVDRRWNKSCFFVLMFSKSNRWSTFLINLYFVDQLTKTFKFVDKVSIIMELDRCSET